MAFYKDLLSDWKEPEAVVHGASEPSASLIFRASCPQELMDRPRQVFGVSIEHWLRGPLREWAEELLREKRLRDEGFFDPAPIRKMWQEHIRGKRRWHYYLWDVLMFQAWLEEQKN